MKQILSSLPLDPTKRLPELICGLLIDQRLEPAYWLACYQHQQFGVTTVPPLLIKAVELADIIQGAGGPAAAWLSSIYSHRDCNELFRPGPEPTLRWPFSLLIVSALLRPALVAPSSGALVLLKKIDGLPAGLRAVCAVVIRADEIRAYARQKESEALAAEALSWWEQNDAPAPDAILTARVWREAEQEGGLLYRLLDPVRKNNAGSLDDLRELLGRLRDENKLKKEITRLYRAIRETKEPDIIHVPGSWQVLAKLKEAVELADRWLRLQEGALAREKEIAVFRAKLRDPLSAAEKELDELARQHQGDHLAIAGVALSKRALASLAAVLRPEASKTLAAEELASLEIARKPQLRHSSLWVPEEEAVERLGKALLELIGDQPLPAFPDRLDELDKVYDNDQLFTPKERDFLMSTFFDQTE